MRPGSPACYACPKSKDRGMHTWTRIEGGARCLSCKLELFGEDGEDVFHGARTPIGELRRPPTTPPSSDHPTKGNEI